MRGGLNLRPQSLAAAALGFVLLLLGFSFATLTSFRRARDLVDHTTLVKAELGDALRLMVDAESGQRGFLLTGDASYLAPYKLARRELTELTQRLELLERDSPEQRMRLEGLERLSESKLDELQETVDLEMAGAHDSALALVRTGLGQRLMDGIRDVDATMVSTEDARLSRHTASAARLARLSFLVMGLACGSLLVLGYLLYSVGRHLAALRVADLENFAGRVAHDIRSPLASVYLAVGLAGRHTGDPRAHGALDRATRTLQRVGQLVDDLLVFAGASALPCERSEAEVPEVVHDVVETMGFAANEKEIDLRLEEPCAATVACSPGVLTSMVSNLVANAIKYLGDAPVKRVTVRARPLGSRTRIEVEDTGPGVPRELWGRIFDPYVRAACTKTPGLGLGLATVRRLAEAHCGSVGIESEVGSGSVFWVELPNAPRPSPEGVGAPGLSGGFLGSSRRRVPG
jgi:signal transduction histidine kinase